MVSIVSSVVALYRKNKQISLDDLRENFPKANSNTLSNALSVARNAFSGSDDTEINFTKITEAEIERVIVAKLNNSLDNANIRLAIDFLKIKRADSGMEEDLDVEKYLKKINSKISAETDNSK